jgi:hypothetical protein
MVSYHSHCTWHQPVQTPPSCEAIALLHHALPAERKLGKGGKLGALCTINYIYIYYIYIYYNYYILYIL